MKSQSDEAVDLFPSTRDKAMEQTLFSEEKKLREFVHQACVVRKVDRYPPDNDFFNRRKNASKAIKLLISNS